MTLDRRATMIGLALGTLGSGAGAQDRGELTIERFGDPAAGPTVLLLHGADGAIQRAGQYRFAANALAAQGFHVVFPHYLDATGDQRAAYREISAKYSVWLDAIAGVAARAAASGGRIGVVGISLGGALALSLAARERRVAAIVSYFGFLPEGVSPGPAPALLFHGDADRVVPVANATRIADALRRAGTSAETVIYPGEGHGFGTATQIDAAQRTAAFLRQALG